MKLGVNIDHIAVLREAREVNSPNLLDALPICDRSGADQITIHLREDRRHIQDKDVTDIMQHSILPINLECAIEPSIIDIVCNTMPYRATLVPEKREEISTEGGLDIDPNNTRLTDAIKRLQDSSIEVSLFVDPTKEAITNSKLLGVEWVELHTGAFANSWLMLYSNLPKTNHTVKELNLPREQLKSLLEQELNKLKDAASLAKELGLKVAAGHGLNYQNVKEIAKIKDIEELNIGQSIIAHSIFTGLERAILDMKELIK